jgi:hypothetical protein
MHAHAIRHLTTVTKNQHAGKQGSLLLAGILSAHSFPNFSRCRRRSGFLRTHCGRAFRNSSFGDTAAARWVAQHRKKTTSVFYGNSDDVGEREKGQKTLEKKNAEVLNERFSKAVITKMDTTTESLTTKIDTTAAALTTKIDTTAEALTTKIDTTGSCQSTHHKDRHTLRWPSCHILSHFFLTYENFCI